MTGLADDALKALPHGPAFRFVDRLLSLEPGHHATGEYVLPADAPFLSGHFPGQPMMPGVLLVEAIAQLGGVAAQCDPSVGPLPGLKLTGVRNAKITGTALPGQTIHLGAKVVGRMGNLVQVAGTATVGDREIVRCEVTLAGTA